jgi:hypothetical protein
VRKPDRPAPLWDTTLFTDPTFGFVELIQLRKMGGVRIVASK